MLNTCSRRLTRRWLFFGAVLGLAWPVAAQAQSTRSTGQTTGSAQSSIFNQGGSAFGASGQQSSAFGGNSFGNSFGSSFGNSMGQSFTGGGTFQGGSFGGGSFSGGSFQGGSFGGGGFQGGQGALGQNSVSVGVSSLGNAFAASYASPWALGLPNGSLNARFGTPMYATVINTTTTTTRTTSAAGRQTGGGGFGGNQGGGSGGFGGNLGGSNMSGAFGTTTTTPQAPRFVVSLTPLQPVLSSPPAQVVAREAPALTQILSRSSVLPSAAGLRVLQEGATVVLRGTAVSEGERRLAEGMIRLSPGVRDVRNEIRVAGAPTGDNP